MMLILRLNNLDLRKPIYKDGSRIPQDSKKTVMIPEKELYDIMERPEN